MNGQAGTNNPALHQGEAQPCSDAQLRERLPVVRDLCASYNRRDALTAMSYIASSRQEVAGELRRITQLISESDFEEAENALAELLAMLETNTDNTELVTLKAYSTAIAKTIEFIGRIGMPGAADPLDGKPIEHFKAAVGAIKTMNLDPFAENISTYALYLEKAAAAGDAQYIARHNQSFVEFLRRAGSGVQKRLEMLNEAQPTAKKASPDAFLLAKLREHCINYNVLEANAVMKEISRFQYESDDGLVEWLKENVNTLAYGPVVERLQDYKA